MSTKYGSTTSRLLTDDIALTDHAIERYRQRTPHECDVEPRTAWRRGEWIKHPGVTTKTSEGDCPERVRIYIHGGDCQQWGVAFIVEENTNVDIEPARRTPMVCVTAINLQTFEHGPTRAYLHSHGPHGGDADE